jgi:hypothetical protein
MEDYNKIQTVIANLDSNSMFQALPFVRKFLADLEAFKKSYAEQILTNEARKLVAKGEDGLKLVKLNIERGIKEQALEAFNKLVEEDRAMIAKGSFYVTLPFVATYIQQLGQVGKSSFNADIFATAEAVSGGSKGKKAAPKKKEKPQTTLYPGLALKPVKVTFDTDYKIIPALRKYNEIIDIVMKYYNRCCSFMNNISWDKMGNDYIFKLAPGAGAGMVYDIDDVRSNLNRLYKEALEPMKSAAPDAMPEVRAAVDDFKQKWEETLQKWKQIDALRDGIKDIDWNVQWLHSGLKEAVKYQTWNQQPVTIQLERWDRSIGSGALNWDGQLHNLYATIIDRSNEVKRKAENYKKSLDFYPHFDELMETLSNIEKEAIKLQGVYLAKTIGSLENHSKGLRANFFDKLRKYPFGHEYARKRLQEVHESIWRDRLWDMPAEIEYMAQPLGSVSDPYPEDPADYDPVVTPIKPGTPEQTKLPFRTNNAVNKQYAEFNSPYNGKVMFSSTPIDMIVTDKKQFKGEFNYGEGIRLPDSL